jgi:citrate lyase beta subunit
MGEEAMSEMSRHTPGPWFLAEKVEGKHTVTNLRRIRSERERIEHGAVCEVYGIADGSEAHANARLIAAAPELLEALEWCAETLAVFVADGSAAPESVIGKNLTTARAAIAKATGGRN